MSETVMVQEHLFDEASQITKMIDFGIQVQSIASGKTPPRPPEGLRVNVIWEGDWTGPKLSGKIAATTYLNTRADGVTLLYYEGALTTPEGDRIAVHADGILFRPEGSTVFQKRETLSFHTASPRYAWVNRIKCWATGSTDFSTGKTTMQGYSA